MSIQQEEAGTGSGSHVIPVHSYVKILNTTGDPVDLSISGTHKFYSMQAPMAVADADKSCWFSATGCKAFRFHFVAGDTEQIVDFVWSTTTAANRTAMYGTLTSPMSTWTTARTTPDGAALTQALSLYPIRGVPTDWVGKWDGTNRIYGILLNTNTNIVDLILETIE